MTYHGDKARFNNHYRSSNYGYRNEDSSYRDGNRNKSYYGDKGHSSRYDKYGYESDSARSSDIQDSYKSRRRGDYREYNEQRRLNKSYHSGYREYDRDERLPGDSDTDGSADSKHNESAKYSNAEDNTTESDGYSTIIVRTLDENVTEDDVDRSISDISIRNGFSPPNSVSIKTIQNNMAQMYYDSNQNENYPFTLSIERVAIVKFPSSSAASKFMNFLKSRMLKISTKEYFVEFYTINGDVDDTSIVNNLNDSNIPDMAEITTLIQKKKTLMDWNCPSCRFLNFSKRLVCLSCGLQKPSDDILECQNKALEIAALNQVQMLQSNIGDIAPWIIIKNISGDADPAKLVLFICKSINGAPKDLQRCVYFIDPDESTRKGFMFAQFSTTNTIEAYINSRGAKKSEVVKFGNTYHRIDTVKSREKHVAEELIKKVKFNILKVNYEFNTITLDTNLTTDENPKRIGNKEVKSCKVKTATLNLLEAAASSNDAASMSMNYLNEWICSTIHIPTGKPDTATFVYDPNTDYFYYHCMDLYYDAASGYYMSMTGDYYLWDEASSSLKAERNTHVVSGVNGASNVEGTGTSGLNNIAGVLASAIKVAQASKESVQQLSTIKGVTKQSIKSEGKPSINLDDTFSSSKFEDEDSMEIEEDVIKGTDTKSDVVSSEGAKVPETKDPIIKALNICFVCLRSFDTIELLAKHEKESKYHQALLSSAHA